MAQSDLTQSREDAKEYIEDSSRAISQWACRPPPLSPLPGALIFHLSCWITLPVVVVAMLVDGCIAEIEDREQGTVMD